MARCVAFYENLASGYTGCNADCWVLPTAGDTFTAYKTQYAVVGDFTGSLLEMKETMIAYLRNEIQGDSLSDFSVIPNEGFFIPQFEDGGGVVVANSPARSLNTVYQLSTGRNAQVSYTVSIATTLLNGGTVFLEISPNGSSGWQEAARFSIANGLILTVTSSMSAFIQAGYSHRLRTTGAATIAYVGGQETLL